MHSENLTQFPTRFVSYPTNRLVGHFSSAEEVQALLPELQGQGVDLGSIYILDSQDGLEALDPDGTGHGTLGMLSRRLHRAASTTEREKFDSVVSHLSQGGLTLAVHAADKALRYRLIDLFRCYGGEEITYMAQLYIEDFR